ncbi:hypothetical protein SCG7109_AF_00070 [Chlamydiales bacterium SCGC AG-110-M15]|nr:hypothetical protein SCG7109_AF_00070 [Chlamydiales bacterium SCGC AG-110-M15]
MRFQIFPLEERIVLDAAGVTELYNLEDYQVIDDARDQVDDSQEIIDGYRDTLYFSPDAPISSTETHVLVISSEIEENELLIQAARDDVLVVYYDTEEDNLEALVDKIEDSLNGTKADSIAFVNHGSDDEFTLNQNTTVNLETLTTDPSLAYFWSSVGDNLSIDGRIDLLACNLASSDKGLQVINKLQELTDADIAASSDETGAEDLGGDWFLEHGSIESDTLYFETYLLNDWGHVLDGNALYREDFEGGLDDIDDNWSNPTGSLVIESAPKLLDESDPDSVRTVLGFNDSFDEVTLKIPDLDDHSEVMVKLDLFIAGAGWAGGPDPDLGTSFVITNKITGDTIFKESFGITPGTGTYDASTPEQNVLGLPDGGGGELLDLFYRLEIPFTDTLTGLNPDTDLELSFKGINIGADAQWAIDNVSIDINALPQVTTPFSGASLNFDGENDFVVVTENSDLELDVSGFTLEAWVHPLDSAPVGNETLIHKEGGYSLARSSTGTFLWKFGDNGDEYSDTGVVIQSNVWSHVAVNFQKDVDGVIDTNEYSLYVNGRLEATGVTGKMTSPTIGVLQTLNLNGDLDKVFDIDNTTEAVFTIITGPSEGTLKRAGLEIVEGETFTESEYANGLITYTADSLDPDFMIFEAFVPNSPTGLKLTRKVVIEQQELMTTSAGNNLYFAGSPEGYFEGLMDDVRIWNKSFAEDYAGFASGPVVSDVIKYHMEHPVSQATMLEDVGFKELLSNWRFDEGSIGTQERTVYDIASGYNGSIGVDARSHFEFFDPLLINTDPLRTDGWTIETSPDLTQGSWTAEDHVNEAVTHIDTGGSPGGYVSTMNDIGDAEENFWTAPKKFVDSMKITPYDPLKPGKLSFDLAYFDNSSNFHLDKTVGIILEASDGTTLVHNAASHLGGSQLGEWTHFSVDLIENAANSIDGWIVGTSIAGSGNTGAVQADIENVLANLVNIRIRAEFFDGVQETGLDNVVYTLADTHAKWDKSLVPRSFEGFEDTTVDNFSNEFDDSTSTTLSTYEDRNLVIDLSGVSSIGNARQIFITSISGQGTLHALDSLSPPGGLVDPSAGISLGYPGHLISLNSSDSLQVLYEPVANSYGDGLFTFTYRVAEPSSSDVPGDIGLLSEEVTVTIDVKEGEKGLDIGAGTALSFDGQNDVVELEYFSVDGGIDSGHELDDTNSMTVETWFKTSVNQGTLISDWDKSAATTVGQNFRLYWDKTNTESNTLHFEVSTVSGASVKVDSGLQLNDNQWHHVAASLDSNTQVIQLYVDGELISEATPPVGETASILQNDTSSVLVGAALDSPLQHADHFEGVIDELRIWALARSSSDIYKSRLQPLLGNEYGLSGYWQFNEPTDTSKNEIGEDDDEYTIHYDRSGNGHHGYSRSIAIINLFNNTAEMIIEDRAPDYVLSDIIAPVGSFGSTPPLSQLLELLGEDPLFETDDFSRTFSNTLNLSSTQTSSFVLSAFNAEDYGTQVISTYIRSFVQLNDNNDFTNSTTFAITEFPDAGQLYTYDSTGLPSTVQGTPLIPGLEVIEQGIFGQNTAYRDEASRRLVYLPDPTNTSNLTFSFDMADDDGIQAGADTTIDVNFTPNVIINSELTVDEEGEAVITNGHLQTVDIGTANYDLIYTVFEVPKYGQLKFGDQVLIQGDTFTQADLDGLNNAILMTYRHDGSEAAVDSFEFAVRDPLHGWSETQVFDIKINQVSDGAPTAGGDSITTLTDGVSDPGFVENDPREQKLRAIVNVLDDPSDSNNPKSPTASEENYLVFQALPGDSDTITASMLSHSFQTQAAIDIVYTLSFPPTEGSLLKSGGPLDTDSNGFLIFTQADIDAGFITYEFDASSEIIHAADDTFIYEVSTIYQGERLVLANDTFNINMYRETTDELNRVPTAIRILSVDGGIINQAYPEYNIGGVPITIGEDGTILEVLFDGSNYYIEFDFQPESHQGTNATIEYAVVDPLESERGVGTPDNSESSFFTVNIQGHDTVGDGSGDPRHQPILLGTGKTTDPGLHMIHYKNPELDYDDNLGGGTPDSSRVDNVVITIPGDESVQLFGKLVAPETANYVLTASADGGVRVWIDGRLVIDNWTDTADIIADSLDLAFTEGQEASIRVEYFSQLASDEPLVLTWAYNNIDEIIPQSAFIPTGSWEDITYTKIGDEVDIFEGLSIIDYDETILSKAVIEIQPYDIAQGLYFTGDELLFEDTLLVKRDLSNSTAQKLVLTNGGASITRGLLEEAIRSVQFRNSEALIPGNRVITVTVTDKDTAVDSLTIQRNILVPVDSLNSSVTESTNFNSFATFEGREVLYLNGEGDKIRYGIAPANLAFVPVAGRTIEGWFQLIDIPDENEQASLFTDQNNYRVYVDEDGVVQWETIGAETVSTNYTIKQNEWTHLTFTHDRATGLLNTYVNGSLVSQNAITDFDAGPNDHLLFTIGNTSDGLNGFKGYIDELRIWEGVQSEADIYTNYIDNSTLGSNATLRGHWDFQTLTSGNLEELVNTLSSDPFNSSFTIAGSDSSAPTIPTNGGAQDKVFNLVAPIDSTPVHLVSGQALEFASVADPLDEAYVTFTDPKIVLSDEDFTIEAWVYLYDLPEGGRNYTIIDQGQIGGDQDFRLQVNSDGKVIFSTLDNVEATPTRKLSSISSVSTDMWHHVAVSYKHNKSQAVIYLDGKQDNQGKDSIIVDINPSTDAFQLGRDIDGNDPFFGIMDDVRVWDTARTASELLDGQFTLTPTNTTGLLAQWLFDTDITDAQGNYDGLSIANAANTTYLNLSEVTGSGDLIRFDAAHTIPERVNISPEDLSPEQLAPEHLVNGASTLGYTLNTASASSGTDFGDTYMIISSLSDNEQGLDFTGEFTVETWLYFDERSLDDTGFDMNKSHTIMDKSTEDGDDILYRIILGNDGKIYLMTGADDSPIMIGSNNTLSSETWNHLAITSDGNDVTFYFNGSTDSTHTYSLVTPTDTLLDTLIGRDHSRPTVLSKQDANQHNFLGYFDDFRVWDVERSSADISDNYNQLLIGDEDNLIAYWTFDRDPVESSVEEVLNRVNSAVDNHATLKVSTGSVGIDTHLDLAVDARIELSNPSMPTHLSSDTTLYFDQSQAAVRISNQVQSFDINATPFAIEAWLYPESGDNGDERVIFSHSSDLDVYEYKLYLDADNRLVIHSGSSSDVESDITLEYNKWQHVAFSYDGSSASLFINGIAVGLENWAPGSTSSDYVSIGGVINPTDNLPQANSAFKGYIDEVRYWDTARSGSDVDSLMTRKLTGSENNLLAYWSFEDNAVHTIQIANSNAGIIPADQEYVISAEPTWGYVKNTTSGLILRIGDEFTQDDVDNRRIVYVQDPNREPTPDDLDALNLGTQDQFQISYKNYYDANYSAGSMEYNIDLQLVNDSVIISAPSNIEAAGIFIGAVDLFTPDENITSYLSEVNLDAFNLFATADEIDNDLLADVLVELTLEISADSTDSAGTARGTDNLLVLQPDVFNVLNLKLAPGSLATSSKITLQGSYDNLRDNFLNNPAGDYLHYLKGGTSTHIDEELVITISYNFDKIGAASLLVGDGNAGIILLSPTTTDVSGPVGQETLNTGVLLETDVGDVIANTDVLAFDKFNTNDPSSLGSEATLIIEARNIDNKLRYNGATNFTYVNELGTTISNSPISVVESANKVELTGHIGALNELIATSGTSDLTYQYFSVIHINLNEPDKDLQNKTDQIAISVRFGSASTNDEAVSFDAQSISIVSNGLVEDAVNDVTSVLAAQNITITDPDTSPDRDTVSEVALTISTKNPDSILDINVDGLNVDIIDGSPQNSSSITLKGTVTALNSFLSGRDDQGVLVPGRIKYLSPLNLAGSNGADGEAADRLIITVDDLDVAGNDLTGSKIAEYEILMDIFNSHDAATLSISTQSLKVTEADASEAPRGFFLSDAGGDGGLIESSDTADITAAGETGSEIFSVENAKNVDSMFIESLGDPALNNDPSTKGTFILPDGSNIYEVTLGASNVKLHAELLFSDQRVAISFIGDDVVNIDQAFNTFLKQLRYVPATNYDGDDQIRMAYTAGSSLSQPADNIDVVINVAIQPRSDGDPVPGGDNTVVSTIGNPDAPNPIVINEDTRTSIRLIVAGLANSADDVPRPFSIRLSDDLGSPIAGSDVVDGTLFAADGSAITTVTELKLSFYDQFNSTVPTLDISQDIISQIPTDDFGVLIPLYTDATQTTTYDLTDQIELQAYIDSLIGYVDFIIEPAENYERNDLDKEQIFFHYQVIDPQRAEFDPINTTDGTPTSDFHGGGVIEYDFYSDPSKATIDLLPLNDAPEINFTSTSSVQYTVGVDGAINVNAAGLTVEDNDNFDFGPALEFRGGIGKAGPILPADLFTRSASVSLTQSTFVDSEDVLSFASNADVNVAGTGTIADPFIITETAGAAFTFEATYDPKKGEIDIVTQDGLGTTPANFSKVLSAITYENTAKFVFQKTKEITFTVSDGVLDSDQVIKKIILTNSNNAPLAVDPGAGTALYFGEPLDAAGVSDPVNGTPTQDAVTIDNDTSLAFSNQMTFEAWILPTGQGSEDSTGGKGGMIMTKQNSFRIARFADGTVRWAFRTSTESLQWNNTGLTLPEGEWNHLAVVFNSDRGEVSTYINGIKGHTADFEQDMTTSSLPLRIGDDISKAHSFEGLIDEVRLWNVARSGPFLKISKDTPISEAEEGLVGYWRFDEGDGNKVFDLTDNGNHGTFSSRTDNRSDGTSGPRFVSEEVLPSANLDLDLTNDVTVTYDELNGFLDYVPTQVFVNEGTGTTPIILKGSDLDGDDFTVTITNITKGASDATISYLTDLGTEVELLDGAQITAFTASAANTLFFTPGSSADPVTINYTVNDGTTDSLNTATLVINVNVLPVLFANAPLAIDEAQEAVIDSTMLQITDANLPPTDDLIITIVKLPEFGDLIKDDTITRTVLGLGSKFSQTDIDNGFILYSHKGTEPIPEGVDPFGLDTFEFIFDDSVGGVVDDDNSVFTIQITPVNDAPQPVSNTRVTPDEDILEDSDPIALLPISDTRVLTINNTRVDFTPSHIIITSIETFEEDTLFNETGDPIILAVNPDVEVLGGLSLNTLFVDPIDVSLTADTELVGPPSDVFSDLGMFELDANDSYSFKVNSRFDDQDILIRYVVAGQLATSEYIIDPTFNAEFYPAQPAIANEDGIRNITLTVPPDVDGNTPTHIRVSSTVATTQDVVTFIDQNLRQTDGSPLVVNGANDGTILELDKDGNYTFSYQADGLGVDLEITYVGIDLEDLGNPDTSYSPETFADEPIRIELHVPIIEDEEAAAGTALLPDSIRITSVTGGTLEEADGTPIVPSALLYTLDADGNLSLIFRPDPDVDVDAEFTYVIFDPNPDALGGEVTSVEGVARIFMKAINDAPVLSSVGGAIA